MINRKGSFATASEVRSSFEVWCRTHQITPLGPTAFGKELSRLGFKREKKGGVQRYLDVSLAAQGLKVVVGNS